MLDTYSNLKASLRNKSHRNDMPDDLLDEFIDQCESDIWQRLRIRSMDTRATASTGSTRYLELPDGFIKMRNLTVNTGGVVHELEFRVPKALQFKDESGVPSQYSVTSQLEFNRIPSTEEIQMQYFRKLAPLSDDNTTNDVLTNFPNIYFYGALKHLYSWTDEAEKEAMFDQKFEREVSQANKQDKKDGYGPRPSIRITGTTP